MNHVSHPLNNLDAKSRPDRLGLRAAPPVELSRRDKLARLPGTMTTQRRQPESSAPFCRFLSAPKRGRSSFRTRDSLTNTNESPCRVKQCTVPGPSSPHSPETEKRSLPRAA
ncbi:hypothetical protein XA68_10859 [Ophiocordyceps unilateralis]|uniref:Uncharacterized protein n=1 Tax=Ophiocordyceps unilateralis TaxID=268505 RepID=A0A2A9NY47_OPHUN|nr:hypothetical protein XA68_10859 [Ophiocordyceps unilateralis]